MIEFEGKVTNQLLHRARQRQRIGIRAIYGALLLIAGIIGFIAQPPPLDPARHGFVVLVAVIGGAILTRALAKPKEIEEVRVSGSISDQRLSIIAPKHEEHLQWTSFSGVILGDDYVVLQQSQFFMIVLGREFFRDAASWEEFRRIVENRVRVVQPQTMASSLMMALLWIGIFALAVLAAYYFNRPG